MLRHDLRWRFFVTSPRFTFVLQSSEQMSIISVAWGCHSQTAVPSWAGEREWREDTGMSRVGSKPPTFGHISGQKTVTWFWECWETDNSSITIVSSRTPTERYSSAWCGLQLSVVPLSSCSRSQLIMKHVSTQTSQNSNNRYSAFGCRGLMVLPFLI